MSYMTTFSLVVSDLVVKRSSESKGLDMEMDKKEEVKIDVKDIHLKLLDDLVNVNSLMTIAVFVGLSMATPGIRSLDSREECHAGPEEAKRLILYEVIAFSCFLLSSVLAKVLKLHLYLDGHGERKYPFTSPKIDLKEVMLALSACGSIAGLISLSLSIVSIIQIRIGLVSCGSRESLAAVLCLSILVGFALVIYVVSMIIAIYASFKSDHHKSEDDKKQNGEAFDGKHPTPQVKESLV